jgi:hypothetical protein
LVWLYPEAHDEEFESAFILQCDEEDEIAEGFDSAFFRTAFIFAGRRGVNVNISELREFRSARRRLLSYL